MNHLARVSIAACVLATVMAGCSRAANGKLTELQRVRSGALDIVLLSPGEGLRHGKDMFVIEFRSAADGRLVDVGDVHGSATMPMPGAPMFGSIEIKRTGTSGRYAADAQFDMAGTWRTTISWQGPTGQGSVTFAGAVQ